MPSRERYNFQARMRKRAYRHGKNWRQVYVDCGGMCVSCYAVDTLEFHEPFREDKMGWGVFQSRVLLCYDCHHEETRLQGFVNMKNTKPSQLAEDVNIEIIMEGGYDEWIERYNLVDRFGYVLLLKGD